MLIDFSLYLQANVFLAPVVILFKGRAMDKKTVLLIAESNEDHFRLIHKNLQSWGVKCPMVHFADGKALLEYLSHFKTLKSPPETMHILLLDMDFPGGDSIELLEMIKKDPKLKYIYVVILAVSYELMTIGKCFGLGCSGYLVKPIKQSEFMTIFNRLCKQGSSEETQAAEEV